MQIETLYFKTFMFLLIVSKIMSKVKNKKLSEIISSFAWKDKY